MSESGLTTIDKALAEIDRLRETLLALRLMPESMPANPVDLAMSAALRRLNFEETKDAFGSRYVTDNVAGFGRIEIAWSEQYSFIKNCVTVRSLGKTRETLPPLEKGDGDWTHFAVSSSKLIEIPKQRLADSPTLFMFTLFCLIADPANYIEVREGHIPELTYTPTPWPKADWEPSEAVRWAMEIQVAKGKPPIASALMKDSTADMTEAERKACELLDKGAFF